MQNNDRAERARGARNDKFHIINDTLKVAWVRRLEPQVGVISLLPIDHQLVAGPRTVRPLIISTFFFLTLIRSSGFDLKFKKTIRVSGQTKFCLSMM